MSTINKVIPMNTAASPRAYANDATIKIATYGIVRIVGSGGAVVLDTDPAIEDGKEDGQIVVIQGTSDTNTVTIADACNTQLRASAITLGQYDNLPLIWDAGQSVWRELTMNYVSKIDNEATLGLAGTQDSLAYRVHEIEKHLHSSGSWFGAANTPTATHTNGDTLCRPDWNLYRPI